MISLFRSYLSTSTARDSLIMLSGTVISTVLGFALTVILTRNLQPYEFGLLITALAFSQLVSDGFELGINPALMNFISKTPIEDERKYLKVTFVAKLIIGSFMALVTFIFASQISLLIFKTLNIVPYIQISALGVFLLTLIMWGQTAFQAKRKFFVAMVAASSINIFRLLIVFAIIFFALFNALNAYLVINLVLIMSLALIFIKTGTSFLKVKFQLSKFKEVFRFGLPVGVSFSLAALYTRLDQIMVFNLLGSEGAGNYGLALRISSFLAFASGSLGSAIAPRFVSLHVDDFFKYFKKTMLAALGLGTVAFIMIPVSPYIFPLIFGNKFSAAILPFQILTVGMIFFILTSPLNSAILYRFKKTKFSLYSAIFSLILIWVLLQMFISRYGIIGASLAVSIVYGLQLVLSGAYFFFLLTKNQPVHAELSGSN